MIKKRTFIITVAIMVLIIAGQTAIIIKPGILGRHEVTTAENALIIAKAAILQEYGEAELQKVSDNLWASIDYERQNYWHVAERDMYGYPPRVLVRRSDGKVIMKWED